MADAPVRKCKKCPSAAVENGFCANCAAEIKRIQEERQQKKQAAEQQKQNALEQRAQDPRFLEIQELKASFQNGPPGTQVCPTAIDKALEEAFSPDSGLTPEKVIAALKAARHATARVPGANANQMFFIFKEAFRRDSSAVLGGSRVKSYFLGAKKVPRRKRNHRHGAGTGQGERPRRGIRERPAKPPSDCQYEPFSKRDGRAAD